MNRDTFLRALKAHCVKAGLAYRYQKRHGRGSHGRVHVGERFTTVKSGEIGNVMKQVMLKQLGLPKDAF